VTDPLVIRRAVGEDDAQAVAALWTEAVVWLKAHGTDQWQYPVQMHTVRAKIDEGVCWGIDGPAGQLTATVTLDTDADPRLWFPDDDPDDALYLHRMVTRRHDPIPQLGSAIVDWASLRTAQAAKTWLRLDAWTTNPGLHGYYRRCGFAHVRTVEHPDIVSGALFQRRAGTVLGRGPQIIEA
jgi:hypothetical protein